jgi:hypothetical protein
MVDSIDSRIQRQPAALRELRERAEDRQERQRRLEKLVYKCRQRSKCEEKLSA